MRYIALAAVAALGVSAPAFAAADNGPYFVVGATHDDINGTAAAKGLGIDGLGATAALGYNMAFGQSFAGVEANFDLSGAKLGDKTNGLYADNQFGISGRFGYHLSEGAAFYGVAGYQRGRASGYSAGVKSSESRDGLRLGAGLEAKVAGPLGVRVEYNHTHFYRANTDPVNTGLANNQAVVGLVYGF